MTACARCSDALDIVFLLLVDPVDRAAIDPGLCGRYIGCGTHFLNPVQRERVRVGYTFGRAIYRQTCNLAAGHCANIIVTVRRNAICGKIANYLAGGRAGELDAARYDYQLADTSKHQISTVIAGGTYPTAEGGIDGFYRFNAAVSKNGVVAFKLWIAFRCRRKTTAADSACFAAGHMNVGKGTGKGKPCSGGFVVVTEHQHKIPIIAIGESAWNEGIAVLYASEQGRNMLRKVNAGGCSGGYCVLRIIEL